MKLLAILAISALSIGAAPIPNSTTFTIENSATSPLGAVTVLTATSPSTILVTTPGEANVTVADNVVGIIIAGQEVDYPNNAVIGLPTGGSIQVVWAGATNTISTFDIKEGN